MMEQEVMIMFRKMFDEAGALSCGSLTFTSNMNKAKTEQNFESLRRTMFPRRKRNVLSGGMFSHNSRAYRHD